MGTDAMTQAEFGQVSQSPSMVKLVETNNLELPYLQQRQEVNLKPNILITKDDESSDDHQSHLQNGNTATRLGQYHNTQYDQSIMTSTHQSAIRPPGLRGMNGLPDITSRNKFLMGSTLAGSDKDKKQVAVKEFKMNRKNVAGLMILF